MKHKNYVLLILGLILIPSCFADVENFVFTTNLSETEFACHNNDGRTCSGCDNSDPILSFTNVSKNRRYIIDADITYCYLYMTKNRDCGGCGTCDYCAASVTESGSYTYAAYYNTSTSNITLGAINYYSTPGYYGINCTTAMEYYFNGSKNIFEILLYTPADFGYSRRTVFDGNTTDTYPYLYIELDNITLGAYIDDGVMGLFNLTPTNNSVNQSTVLNLNFEITKGYDNYSYDACITENTSTAFTCSTVGPFSTSSNHSVPVEGLSLNTTYKWYVNASSDYYSNNSGILYFNTIDEYLLSCTVNTTELAFNCQTNRIVNDTSILLLSDVDRSLNTSYNVSNPFKVNKTTGLQTSSNYYLQIDYGGEYSNGLYLTTYECYQDSDCGTGYNCTSNICTFIGQTYNNTQGEDTLVLIYNQTTYPGAVPFFAANYTNNGTIISGASCNMSATGLTETKKALNPYYISEGVLGYYGSYNSVPNISTITNGSILVICAATGYNTLEASGNFTIQQTGNIPTQIIWVNKPTTSNTSQTVEFSINYKTIDYESISGATCTLFLGIQNYTLTDYGGGLYERDFTFSTTGTYQYSVICIKTGYNLSSTPESNLIITTPGATTTISTITTTTTTTTTTTSTTTTITPLPTQNITDIGFNCTNLTGKLKEGDVFHCAVCPFITILGVSLFYGLTLLLIITITYKIGGAASAGVLGLVYAGAFLAVLPAPTIQYLSVTLGICVGLLLYSIFRGRGGSE